MKSEERAKLIDRYAEGPAVVGAALKRYPEGSIAAHPIPGKWSAREIIQHLGDSETISAIRLRRLISEEYPVIQGYDQEAYAILLRYNLRDHAPAFEAFRAARDTTTQLLHALGDDDWTRRGWHTEAGLYTVSTWLEIYAAHAHNHAAQIDRLREALEKKAG